MKLLDVYFSHEMLEEMFPTDDDGNVTNITETAWTEAKKVLGIGESVTIEVSWHTPGVFDVRYGSSYVASAIFGQVRVRFHAPEGDFREGDDKM
jgi:hypothetical protein